MAPQHRLSHTDGTCQSHPPCLLHVCPQTSWQDRRMGQTEPWQGHEARGAAARTKPPHSRLLALEVCALVGNMAGEMGSTAYADSCPLLQAEGPSSLQMFHTNCCKPQGPAELSSAQAALGMTASQGG